MDLPSRPSTWPLVLAVLLLLLARVPEVVKMPLVDQANFLLVAREIADGRVLYRDILDVKPPLIFWIYFVFYKLAGLSYVALVIVDYLVTILTVVLVRAALIARIAPPALDLGILFWTLCASFPVFSGEIGILQPETVENLLIAITLWLAGRDRLHGVVLGILAGLGVLAKILPGGLILVLGWMAVSAERRTRVVAGSIAGVLGVLALFVAQLQLTGSLDGFREALEIAARPSANDFGFQSQFLAAQLPMAAVPGLLALAALILGPRTHGFALLAAWLALAALQIAIPGRYWGYHFIVLLPPLGLMAGWGLDALRARLGAGLALRGTALAILLQGILAAHAHLEINPLALGRLTGHIPQDKYESATPVTWNIGADQVREVAGFLERSTQAGDRVFVFGIIPQILLRSGRPMFGPYIFHYANLVPDPRAPPGGRLAARRVAFFEEWRRDPPAAVVVADTQAPSPGIFETGRELASTPELVERLSQDYRPFPLRDITVFLRKDRAPADAR